MPGQDPLARRATTLALLGTLAAAGRGAGAQPVAPTAPEPPARPCGSTAPQREATARRLPLPDGESIEAFERALREGMPVERAALALRTRRGGGYLGVLTQEVSETRLTGEGRLVRYCSYPLVISVERGSPAERGGIASGDTIVSYAGRDLVRSGEIPLDRLLVPGDTLRVGLRREGRDVVRSVVVGRRAVVTLWSDGRAPLAAGGNTFTMVQPNGDGTARVTVRRLAPAAVPNAPAPPAPPGAPDVVTGFAFGFGDDGERIAVSPLPLAAAGPNALVLAGAQVLAMDDDLREAMRAPVGLLVARVYPGTTAAEAGLRGGDVVVRVAGQPVRTVTGFHRALLRGVDGRSVTVTIERRGKSRDVVLRW